MTSKLNRYRITLRNLDTNRVIKREVRAANAFQAADLAEEMYKPFTAEDAKRLSTTPRVNYYPTMLGN